MADMQKFLPANGVSPEESGKSPIIQEILKPLPFNLFKGKKMQDIALGLETILNNIRKSPLIKSNDRIKGLSMLLPKLILDVRDGFPLLNEKNQSIAITALEKLLDETNNQRYSRTAPIVIAFRAPTDKGFYEINNNLFSTGNASSKCNLFVFDVLKESGIVVLIDRIGPDRNPGATVFADNSFKFKNLSSVLKGINLGAPGDVIAFLSTNHTGIYIGNGLYIGATTAGVNFQGESNIDFVCIATVEINSQPVIRKILI